MRARMAQLGVMQAEVGGQSVQRDQWIALAMVGLKRVQRHGRDLSTRHNKATEDPPQATAKATLATDDAAKLCQPATTGVVIIYYTT